MGERVPYTEADKNNLALCLLDYPEHERPRPSTHEEIAKKLGRHPQQSWHTHYRDNKKDIDRRIKLAKRKRDREWEGKNGATQEKEKGKGKRKRVEEEEEEEEDDSPPPQRKGKTAPIKKTRNKFDDETDWDPLIRTVAKGQRKGWTIMATYQKLAELRPDHTAQSWQDYHKNNRPQADKAVKKYRKQGDHSTEEEESDSDDDDEDEVQEEPRKKKSKVTEIATDSGSERGEEEERSKTKAKSKKSRTSNGAGSSSKGKGKGKEQSKTIELSESSDDDSELEQFSTTKTKRKAAKPVKRQSIHSNATSPAKPKTSLPSTARPTSTASNAPPVASTSKATIAPAPTQSVSAPPVRTIGSPSKVLAKAVTVPLPASPKDAKRPVQYDQDFDEPSTLSTKGDDAESSSSSSSEEEAEREGGNGKEAEWSENDDSILVHELAVAELKGREKSTVWDTLDDIYPQHSASEWKQRYMSNMGKFLLKVAERIHEIEQGKLERERRDRERQEENERKKEEKRRRKEEERGKRRKSTTGESGRQEVEPPSHQPSTRSSSRSPVKPLPSTSLPIPSVSLPTAPIPAPTKSTDVLPIHSRNLSPTKHDSPSSKSPRDSPRSTSITTTEPPRLRPNGLVPPTPPRPSTSRSPSPRLDQQTSNASSPKNTHLTIESTVTVRGTTPVDDPEPIDHERRDEQGGDEEELEPEPSSLPHLSQYSITPSPYLPRSPTSSKDDQDGQPLSAVLNDGTAEIVNEIVEGVIEQELPPPVPDSSSTTTSSDHDVQERLERETNQQGDESIQGQPIESNDDRNEVIEETPVRGEDDDDDDRRLEDPVAQPKQREEEEGEAEAEDPFIDYDPTEPIWPPWTSPQVEFIENHEKHLEQMENVYASFAATKQQETKTKRERERSNSSVVEMKRESMQEEGEEEEEQGRRGQSEMEIEAEQWVSEPLLGDNEGGTLSANNVEEEEVQAVESSVHLGKKRQRSQEVSIERSGSEESNRSPPKKKARRGAKLPTPVTRRSTSSMSSKDVDEWRTQVSNSPPVDSTVTTVVQTSTVAAPINIVEAATRKLDEFGNALTIKKPRTSNSKPSSTQKPRSSTTTTSSSSKTIPPEPVLSTSRDSITAPPSRHFPFPSSSRDRDLNLQSKSKTTTTTKNKKIIPPPTLPSTTTTNNVPSPRPTTMVSQPSKKKSKQNSKEPKENLRTTFERFSRQLSVDFQFILNLYSCCSAPNNLELFKTILDHYASSTQGEGEGGGDGDEEKKRKVEELIRTHEWTLEEDLNVVEKVKSLEQGEEEEDEEVQRLIKRKGGKREKLIRRREFLKKLGRVDRESLLRKKEVYDRPR